MTLERNHVAHAWTAGVLGACLLVCPMVPARAMDPHVSMPLLGGYLRETRIVYPLRVLGWEAQGEKRYEQPELGVSVRYAHADADRGWIDVFFYPAGEADTFLLDTHSRVSVAEIAALSGQNGVIDVRFHPATARRIALEGVDPTSADGEVRTVSGWIERDSGRLDTAMTIGLRQLYFVKGRYSRPTDTGDRPIGDTLGAFIDAWMPAISLQSTGACGRLPPIDVLDAGAELPSDVIASVDRDDIRRAVLLPNGRVLSREAGDPAGTLLAAAGAALREQRYPGCAGESPVEPEVPEGHREIRIEYRPTAASQPTVQVD